MKKRTSNNNTEEANTQKDTLFSCDNNSKKAKVDNSSSCRQILFNSNRVDTNWPEFIHNDELEAWSGNNSTFNNNNELNSSFESSISYYSFLNVKNSTSIQNNNNNLSNSFSGYTEPDNNSCSLNEINFSYDSFSFVENSFNQPTSKTSESELQKPNFLDENSSEFKLKKPKFIQKKLNFLNDTIDSHNVLNETKMIIHKKQIVSLFEYIFSMKIPYKLLTDIEFDHEGAKFTVVGSTAVPGSSKYQMRHVTPISFIKHVVKSAIIGAKFPDLILASFSQIFKVLIRNKPGYCFSAEDLVNYPTTLRKEVTEKSKKVLVENTNTLYLISPERLSKKTAKECTPNKTKKALTKFNEENPKYIEIAINKLADLIKGDLNTANIAAEILSRFIFQIFNNQEGGAFPEEGNTQNFEIRLYNSKEEALKSEALKSLDNYEVVSVKELKKIHEKSATESSVEPISGRIRLAHTEGSDINKVAKSLKALDDIILSSIIDAQDINTKIIEYNKIKPIKLILANSDEDLSEYHQALSIKNHLNKLPLFIAKLVYFAFDLKALEITVLAENDEGNISLYNRTTSKELTEYSFKDGPQYRSNQIKKASGKYNKDVIFRSEVTTLESLKHKIVNHFIISTMAYKSFEKLKDLLTSALTSLVKLAAIDYAIEGEQERDFLKEAKNLYCKSIAAQTNDNLGTSHIELNVQGENFTNILGDPNIFDISEYII